MPHATALKGTHPTLRVAIKPKELKCLDAYEQGILIGFNGREADVIVKSLPDGTCSKHLLVNTLERLLAQLSR